jgi:hypothetical protein
MDMTPRPPSFLGTQTSVQATLHWPPLQVSSPAQRKALLLLSIALITPVGSSPVAIAWASMEVRTRFTRRRRGPLIRERASSPTGKAHIAFSHNRVGVREAKLVIGKG